MEELNKLGYSLTFSEACSVTAWGKWYVHLKNSAGYG